MAIISVPGEYAARGAQGPWGGMDVLLFSDNVSVEDEVALKRRAHALGRPAMGPGAGRRDPGRARSGSRTPSPRAGRGGRRRGDGRPGGHGPGGPRGRGSGRCYGTGGRDLKEEVGAVTALDAIGRLAEDDGTDVILCVSKPPRLRGGRAGPARASSRVRDARGGLPGRRGGHHRSTGSCWPRRSRRRRWPPCAWPAAWPRRPRDPRADCRGGAVRGSSRRHLSEASAILAERLGRVSSNAPSGRRPAVRGAAGGPRLPRPRRGGEFTRGRPHPMIDPEARPSACARRWRTRRSGCCCSTSSSASRATPTRRGAGPGDPGGPRGPSPDGRGRAYVLGTEADPQVRSRQVAALAGAGARLAPTNAAAARLAAALAG